MKVWLVYFRGEVEYASTHYYDAVERMSFLRKHYGEESAWMEVEEV